ncbi:MAG: beta-ketoacyl synthase chain length factor [Thermomonas sp.]
MSSLAAGIAGIGFWANGIPTWTDALAFARERTLPEHAPAKPSPQLLAPNERRRAPESVAVALEVALAACTASGRDPSALPSVFASTHGDLAITDYVAATLASEPRALSPTKFHNSVHNAAAGYWTIGNGCTAPTTAISAYDASFAQGLLEALSLLASGHEAVLLAAFDAPSTGPLSAVSRSEGLLGGALVLVADAGSTSIRLRATPVSKPAPVADGALGRHYAGNAMRPMLALFDALASGGDVAWLHAGPGRALRVECAHG